MALAWKTAAWLREHPGVEVVCRDGSAAYAEAIRQAVPHAVQASDRWHLWHNLAAAVEKTVIAHSACRNTTPSPEESALAARTRAVRGRARPARRGRRVAGVRAAAGLGTEHGQALRPRERVEDLLRPPRYGTRLVDPHRDLVRQRLAEKMPVTRILAEIRGHGYTGSSNLLVRYINQGRADPERVAPAPRRLVSWLMSRPADLPDHTRRHLDDLIAACSKMTTLAARVREFAAILTGRHGEDLPG